MTTRRGYSRYVSTNIPWQRRVPQSWTLTRIKRFLSEKRTRIAPELPCGAISFGRVVLKDGESIPVETRATYQEVLAGEFLVNPINLNYDLKSLRTALSSLDVCVSPAYIVLRAGEGVDPRFIAYLLYCFDAAHMKTLGAGVRQTITFADIGDCECFIPSLSEQRAIAALLDRETARIDALIEKKTRFIELLREKRQAVIRTAVTKGAEPGVSLKASGVDWIGLIPSHWDIGRAKAWFRSQSGGTPDTANFDEFYAADAPNRWVRTLDLANSPLHATELGLTAKGLRSCAAGLLPEGSVLIAMYGGDGTIGKNALLKIQACTNQAICALLPNEEFDPRFTFRYIQFLRPFWMIDAASTRKDPNISQEQIRNAFMLKPPLEEQRAIADHIDRSVERLDGLVFQSEVSIELLRERRTALITAAVTGQIDVSAKAPAEEPEPA